MKIAMIVVRTLMGLLFLFASATYLFKLMTPPEATGAMKVFDEGLKASVYMMPTVKVIELICALALLSGFFVPLAVLLLSPIIVNIFLVHAFLAPSGLPMAILLGLGNIFLGYYYWDRYKAIFRPK